MNIYIYKCNKALGILRTISFSVLEHFSASLFPEQKPIYCLFYFYRAIVLLTYFVSIIALQFSFVPKIFPFIYLFIYIFS